MSSGYVDTQIIECSRLHSEEAKSNNNENYSLWTNNLTDVIHLDAGDQVSVFGAMISERGAGQADVIEIKGESLGFKKTFEFIEINASGNLCENIPTKNDRLVVNVSTKDVEMRDDTAVFKIGYYITADGHNYIQLPRRFWWRPNLTSVNFTQRDIGPGAINSTADSGRSLWDPFNASQGTATSYHDTYQLFDEYYQNADERYGYSSQLNNGRRYTIMIRDDTLFSDQYDGLYPDDYLRDPENGIYRRYTELKEIQVDKGFNSPEYIATDVTRKLQSVLSTNTFEYRVAGDLSGNASRPGFPIKQFKTYTTETYKPFNVAWNYKDDIKSDFETYISPENNEDGWEYLSQYHITACLRPELYETGRLINYVQFTYEGIQGTSLRSPIESDDQFMITRIRYEEPYISYFKDFIRAQEKYPEVFNIFSDSRTPYDSGDNINNSRYFHMNRFTNASMTLNYPSDTFGGQAQLGWGGYIQPSWRTTEQLSALLVPFVYDDSQRDIFYENPDDGLNQLSYGCFSKQDVGGIDWLKVKISPHNDFNSNLFTTLLNGSTKIEEFRSCGYDMHFNSVGNQWILPHSGHTIKPNSFNGNASQLQSSRQYANQGIMDTATPGPWYVDFPHLSQLYIGADTPKLNWDGAHFTLSDLHTGINRGNDRRAGAPFYVGVDAIDIVGAEAADIVYKINPREQYEDWTPVRMPYTSERTTYINGSHVEANAYEVDTFNENLTQWQIYDASCGIFIEDFGLTEQEWSGSFWERLGFSYAQFHNASNTRLERVEKGNANKLSIITTNSEVDEGDTKILSQNTYKAIFYNNMIPRGTTINSIAEGTSAGQEKILYLPEIIQKTQSISLIADNLPTRMIRGYYTIRSNIIEENPFIGGKKDNTIMPICGIVNKINGAGDFYQQEGSEVSFTITKPLRLASIKCSIHDPNGSYANSNEQNTVLFKVVKQKNFTFNVVQELIAQNGGKMPAL